MSNAVKTLNPVLGEGNTTINNSVSTALISQVLLQPLLISSELEITYILIYFRLAASWFSL